MRKSMSVYADFFMIAFLLTSAALPAAAKAKPKPPVTAQTHAATAPPSTAVQSLLPKVKVLEPKPGPSPFVPGWPLLVLWTYTGNPPGLAKIVLLKGTLEVATLAAGTPWGTGGAGCFTATMPADAFGLHYYKVKVFSPANSDYAGTSAEFVAIPLLKVQAPITDGQTWKVGETHTVTWKYSGGCGNTVSIKAILTNSQWAYDLQTSWPIGSNWNGSFPWTIPATIPAGEYRIYLKSGNSAGSDRTAIFNLIH